MSFVPVTGAATLRPAEPPRDSVIEFSDERRTVALPIRAALPVLTKARARDDVHPSVGLLSGAVLLGMRLVAAGKFEPADGQESWRVAPLDAADDERVVLLAGSRAYDGLDAASAERLVRLVLDAVADVMPRSAPVSTRRAPVRPAAATSGPDARTPPTRGVAAGDRFAERLQARIARHRAPEGSPTAEAGPRRPTCHSSCGSRCASRPTRRSWWPAPCASSCRCTTSVTRCTSVTPRCSSPRPGPGPPTGSAPARARTRASRCGRRLTRGRSSTVCSRCGCPTRSPSTPTSW